MLVFCVWQTLPEVSILSLVVVFGFVSRWPERKAYKTNLSLDQPVRVLHLSSDDILSMNSAYDVKWKPKRNIWSDRHLGLGPIVNGKNLVIK